jgi:hypothetical protein
MPGLGTVSPWESAEAMTSVSLTERLRRPPRGRTMGIPRKMYPALGGAPVAQEQESPLVETGVPAA